MISRATADAIDWTEGGRYDVRTIRLYNGETEIRRYRTCACGCRWDVDIISACQFCEDNLEGH